jgi:hypothetical protein
VVVAGGERGHSSGVDCCCLRRRLPPRPPRVVITVCRGMKVTFKKRPVVAVVVEVLFELG